MELRIEKGGLEAKLIMVPEKNRTGASRVSSRTEVEEFLREKGVKVPLETGALDEALERMSRGMAAEAVVARGRPPVPGIDVFGDPLPSRPGKPLEPRLGAHTVRASHDPSLIVSQTAGHVRLRERGAVVDRRAGPKTFFAKDGAIQVR